MDLVSYNSKNNMAAWPFGLPMAATTTTTPRDSSGDQALRRQRLRNFWTIQFFSRGVPMVVWGDEFGRTQSGNNNAYNVDGIGTWNHYGMAATAARLHAAAQRWRVSRQLRLRDTALDCNPLFRFAAFVAGLRRSHPALCPTQVRRLRAGFRRRRRLPVQAARLPDRSAARRPGR